MNRRFRVIDTGLRDGRENIAFDEALIEAHQQGIVPDTIRFMHFPPTVLIGRHQALSHEIQLDYCQSHGIGIVRRITGGGAIYLDPGQVGWELVFNRKTLGAAMLEDLARRVCMAVARGLGHLGIEAAFRPRNDIEVGGRKISGTGGFFDGDTMIYQGTVLVDMNPDIMVAALNVPQAKLQRRQLDSAAGRVVTVRELLGDATPGLEEIQQALLQGFAEELDIEPVPGEITEDEERLARQAYDDEIGTDEFVAEIDDPGNEAGVLTGSHTGPGGTVNTYIRLNGPARGRIGSVLITGDFFVTPPRLVFDLEAALRGAGIDQAGQIVEQFFEQADTGMLSVTPADFRQSIEAALSKVEQR
jgi:lipoate-protein ligase A